VIRCAVSFEQLAPATADVGFMLEPSEKVPARPGSFLFAEILEDWVEHREGEQGSLEGLNPPLRPAKPPPWDEAWLRRRRAGRALGVSVVSTLLAGILGEILREPLCVVLVLVGMAASAGSAIRLSTFTCPRCGRRFDTLQKTRRLRVTNAFTHRCLYCGLEVGQRS